MNKTVFFLGAGFSKDAGGPIQNEIIEKLLSLEFEIYYQYNETITKARKKFVNFLKNELHIERAQFENVALEDVFTPIDRCIADGISYRNHSVKSLVDLREDFHMLMAASIKYGVDLHTNITPYISDFANYINKRAKVRINNIDEDNIAIITTNWDILLDNKLHEAIGRNDKDTPLSVVDYCCYISSLEDDPSIKPGLFALGKSGYNIKYLKLHGSMNWLHCPMCQRMYVKFEEKIILSNPKYCKHCKTNYNLKDQPSIKLRSNLLLPTFLKDLSNIQIKLVWQNTAIELAEASKIVFIGYSLPFADFEIRQLLSRTIRNNAEVEVLIYPYNTEKDICQEMKRYKAFFGRRIKDNSFILKTVPDYVSSLHNDME